MEYWIFNILSNTLLSRKNMNWDDPTLNTLASEYFRLFSRFEYALKASGYLLPNSRNAKADWERFAIEINDVFDRLDNQELKNAIALMLSEPPKKQINNNGVVDWDETQPGSKNQTDLLLLYVRRIRNNLFHGGKFNGHWFEPERSGPLIDSGIKILNACLQVSKNVSQAYRS